MTDIVRTGDKMVVPQEGMRKANGGKVSQASKPLCCYTCCIDSVVFDAFYSSHFLSCGAGGFAYHV